MARPRKIAPTRAKRSGESVAKKRTAPLGSPRPRCARPAATSASATACAVVSAESTSATACADGRPDGLGQHREMGAAEHQRIRRAGALEQGTEIMRGPQRSVAGVSVQPSSASATNTWQGCCTTSTPLMRRLDGAGISAALDRALGRDHGDAAIAGRGDACARARLDHADHRDRRARPPAADRAPRPRPCCRRSPASSRLGRAGAASPGARRPAPSRRSWCRRAAARCRRDRRSARWGSAPPARGSTVSPPMPESNTPIGRGSPGIGAPEGLEIERDEAAVDRGELLEVGDRDMLVGLVDRWRS